MERRRDLSGDRGMGIFTYLSEMLDSSAIFLEVLRTGITEEPRRTGSFVRTEVCIFDLFSKVLERLQWIWSIRKVSALGTPSNKSGMKQWY